MSTAAALAAVILDQLGRHAPFSAMAREHLEWMIERLHVAYYARNEIVLDPRHSPDTFYIIKQGVVVASRTGTATGVRQDWLELREGECFPFAALISGRPVVSTYRAVSDVFCFELAAADYKRLLGMSAAFHEFCTRRLASLFGEAKRSLQSQYAQSIHDQQSLMSPLSAVMRRNPVTCTPDTPLREVLDTMNQKGIGSMVAVDAQQRPLGIFTLRDILPRVVLPKTDLSVPFSSVMTPEPVCMQPQHFAHDAALAMARHGFRHILVTEDGRLSGLVSERDLFALQRLSLRQVGDAIRHAGNLTTLKTCAADIRQLAHNMLAQGVGSEQLAQIISTLNDVLTERILQLEIQAQPAVGGIEICWLALGSEGRLEQTLNTDQDNGILFRLPPGQTADGVRAVLLPFARRVNEALAECGFPLCAGAVMASNPQWCLSLEEWRGAFSKWIDQGDPGSLLNVSIFFDFRALWGQHSLATELREWLRDKAAGNPRFLHQMTANALRNKPPLGVLREFTTREDHTIDLKLNGTTPFVDAARILALARGGMQTGTAARLRGLIEAGHLPEHEGEACIDAFLFIQLLRLRLHHQQTETGVALSNNADPDQLNPLDRRILREAFRQARKLQGKLALDHQV